jgi:hypothetical protein
MEPSVAGAAAPARRTARLVYRVDPSSSACPGEGLLRDAVAARLGYQPFTDEGPGTITVSLRRAEGAFRAALEVRDAAGVKLGEKQLSSTAKDCAELAAATALSVSIAIDPLTAMRPPPAAPVLVATDAPPPRPAQASAPAPAATPTPVAFRVGGGLFVGFGHTPAVSLGLQVEARLAWERFSLGLDVRPELPRSVAFAGGWVDSTLISFGLSPCAHLGPADACAVVVGGAMHSAGRGFTQAQSVTSPHLLAGLRLGVRLPLGDRWSLRAHAETLARLVSVRLLVDQQEAWASPIFSGSLMMSAVVTF